MSFEISTNTLVSVGFALFSAVLVVIFQRQTERLKIVESQLSQSKYKVYYDLVTIFFNIINDSKSGKELNIPDLTTKMINLKKDILIYGSDEIVLLLSKWLQYTTEKPDDATHIWVYLDLLIKIRKDMGHRKTIISRDDIMILIMQNKSEYGKLKSTL